MFFILAIILFAALIVWLVLNGINEMRWVQAHLHDEEVANDPGIIPKMSELSGTGQKIKEKTQAAFQEDGALGKAKQHAQNAMKDDGALGKAKQKAQDSMKDDGLLGKAKQKAQDSMKDDGLLGKAKQKAQDAMKDDGALGKAKQKLREGDYVNKAKDLTKGAGEKIKGAGAAARSRAEDMRN